MAGSSGAAPLYGLVLVGGRSERMRGDGSIMDARGENAGKAGLAYHGRSQAAHTADLLSRRCSKVFLSCRADQAGEPAFAGLSMIHDAYRDLGPLAGILSALDAHPEAAFLVAACDLPYLDAASVDALADGRDSQAFATAFEGPLEAKKGHRHRGVTPAGASAGSSGPPGAGPAPDPDAPEQESLGPNGRLPEPLFAIFEPRMGPRIHALMPSGLDCPRKAIIRSRSRILPAPDPRFLLNVNEPEEYRRALRDFAQPRPPAPT